MKKLLLVFILGLSISEAAEMPHFDSSVPNSLRLFLTQALTEAFQIQGSGATRLHQQIFQGAVSGHIYKKWFLDRVKKITMTNSCGMTATIDSTGEPGVVYVSHCVNVDPNDSQRFYWISVLFHEARHLEPKRNYWRHEIGLDSFGHPMAYDSSAVGAFAVEKVLARNVVRYCRNCRPEFVKQANEVYEDTIVWNKLQNPAILLLEQDLEGI